MASNNFQAPNKPPSIAKWLVECLTDEVTGPDGRRADLAYVAVCHSPSDKEILTLPLKGKSLDQAGCLHLAETLYGRCESDAEGLSGRQRYVLYAFYEGLGASWSRRKPIEVNGHIVNSFGDHSTEPATPEGRFAQRMRQDEAHSQLLIHGNAQLIQQTLNYGTLMADRAERAETRNAEMFLKFQELVMEMMTAQDERERKRLEYERNSKLMEQAAKLAPLLLNTFTGKEIIPQSAADTAILEGLAEALDEESVQKVVAAIGDRVPAPVMGLVFQRLGELAEAKKRGKERVEGALAKGGGFTNGAAGEFETPKH
jgi:hypothetical protein